MSRINYIPIPVFDTLTETSEQYKIIYSVDNPRTEITKWLVHCFNDSKVDLPSFAIKDYQVILNFLYSYRGSEQTFNVYRRDMERLLQWSWFVKEQSILKHKRDDIEAFIEFCIKPYKRWIGTKTVARFKTKNGEKIPNPEWRPFEARLSKTAVKKGEIPDKTNYVCSQKTIKSLFAVLGSFYNYALQEEWAKVNPVVLIRQKSKFLQKNATAPVIRRLSDKQWQTVIACTKAKAKDNKCYEREVFLLSCLYSLYLRISELVAKTDWTPTMGDFFQDNDQNWWFKTLGKGKKLRQIAVSDAMLNALKYYRTVYLELSPYPAISEKTPLISQVRDNKKPIANDRSLRKMVQTCFDDAISSLQRNEPEEAESLAAATVHWLRHTGISDDVKTRPREHVRDDAGHSSSAITDRYIDVELKARAQSAKKKPIIENTNFVENV